MHGTHSEPSGRTVCCPSDGAKHEQDRGLIKQRENIESLILRKWFLDSALACLHSGEVVPQSFKEDVLSLVDSLEKETQKYTILISKEHEIQSRQSRELERLRQETKELIQTIRREPTNHAQKLERMEESLLKAKTEKEQLLEARSKLPWFQESEMMRKEAEGLRKQKEVLLSKLEILNQKPVAPH